MTMTELVPYDPAFARFQTTGVPVIHRALYQKHLVALVGDLVAKIDRDYDERVAHDVDWRFYDPSVVDLDHLEGLDYWDQLRLRHPEQVDTAKFLDNYALDHVAETGRTPHARWYADARRRQRQRRHTAVLAKRDRDWDRAVRSFATPDVTFSDHEAGTLTGTETFSSYRVETTAKGAGNGPVVRYDERGEVIPVDGLALDRETVSRYVDRSVSEAKIFNPGDHDGFTLMELLEDMERFVKPVLPDAAEPDPVPVDPRYGKRDVARHHLDAARDLVDYEELRAKAIEICRFKWSDQMADKDEKMARGRIHQSKLHDWGLDTWQIVVTRRRRTIRRAGKRVEINRYTVIVRTHVGQEKVERRGRPDLIVWKWEPHYWRQFNTEDEALDWSSRLSDAFTRESVGDLDDQRWPQNLTNDRVVASSQAAAHSEQWARWDRDGWTVHDLDGAPLPGQIPFEPGQPNSWDPYYLQQQADGEPPVPEPAQ